MNIVIDHIVEHINQVRENLMSSDWVKTIVRVGS